jgi:hypothetical protein
VSLDPRINVNIVVGILQVDLDPWREMFKEGQSETWMKNNSDAIQIVNLFGRKPGKVIIFFDHVHEKCRWHPLTNKIMYFLDGILSIILRSWTNPKWRIVKKENFVDMYVNVPSALLTHPIRELALFNYFLKFTDANFLYMSNSSSYIRLDLLNELTHEFQKDNVYGGTMGSFDSIRFASGSNRIFSRDIVQHIVNKVGTWDFRYLNDVLIGKVLSGVEFHEVEIPSLAFSTVGEINTTTDSKLKNVIHYRLKSGDLSARLDKQLMLLIHRRLNELD